MLLENLAAQLENNKTVLTSRYPSPKQNRKYSYSHKTIERQHDRILSNIEGKKDQWQEGKIATLTTAHEEVSLNDSHYRESFLEPVGTFTPDSI